MYLTGKIRVRMPVKCKETREMRNVKKQEKGGGESLGDVICVVITLTINWLKLLQL